MTFCDQCGSATRDKEGFCGGCGAPWPMQPTVAKADTTGRSIVSVIENSSANSADGLLYDVRPKRVWVAILLALLCGPFGLFYCTVTGAIVMLIASIALQLMFGRIALFVIVPACVLWAWKAARESESMFE